jgi:peptidoglycan/LPS O-acetylase OafA/YrhL
MGSLRTLFAIAVVFAHSYGYVFVGGRNAVQLFYMISGFLISYVIVEKKAYSTIKSFYINRYLRLYPIYIVVAALTFIAFLIAAFVLNKNVEFFNIYYTAPFSANALLIFSNISLFLQDWVMFAGVEHNQLVFATNFSKSDIVLAKGLLVPQAWTLGVELSFYLIAPFILPKRKILATLLFLSIALRIYLIYIGLGRQDPWTYRFFPTELALFLLGAISHQVILPFYRNVFSTENIEKYSTLSTYFLILITLVFWLIPINELIKSAALFAIFLVLMPLTFLFQSKRDWDKWVGDLSYPIYICHMLVIYVIGFIMGKLGIENTITISLAAVAFSVCLSIALNTYIGKPVESLRSKLRSAN